MTQHHCKKLPSINIPGTAAFFGVLFGVPPPRSLCPPGTRGPAWQTGGPVQV